MRPHAAETIAIVQAALQELAREASSDYGRAQVNLCLMLLQSVAAELDSAAHDLFHDLADLRDVLSTARAALVAAALPAGEALIAEIDGALAEPSADDLRLSSLRARRERLLALLERFLCLCEDAAGTPAYDELLPARWAAYDHLRRAALRGWSFWDVSSFREVLARWRTGTAG